MPSMGSQRAFGTLHTQAPYSSGSTRAFRFSQHAACIFPIPTPYESNNHATNMDRPDDSQQPPPDGSEAEQPVKVVPPSYRSLYLILYNFVSAVLWSVVLGRTLLIAGLYGNRNVHVGVGEFTKWTQTLAALEVVHAAVGGSPLTSRVMIYSPDSDGGAGLVRAPLLTTAMQVASRFLLVWIIAFFFPGTVARSVAGTTMLLAWSVTELTRYSFFASNLAYGRVPGFLTWLRYNGFFLLYPLGISSECWLIWQSQAPGVARFGMPWQWFCRVVLFVYIPGAYILFTHMMAQRRKVMRSLSEKKDA
ncbi:hypothetical protein LTR53_013222 [Teratosphaeriaceae sp. CCFEE 6253]|nr:hypothetical protein LTR53_013222 [Teratosphaeriaceae sp. CCFEE 6253]